MAPVASWKPTGPPSAMADFISASQAGHHAPHGPSVPLELMLGWRFVNIVIRRLLYFGTSVDSTVVAVLKPSNAKPYATEDVMPTGWRVDSWASIEASQARVSASCIALSFSGVVVPLGATFIHAAWLTAFRFQAAL